MSNLLVRGCEREDDGLVYLDSSNTAPWLEDRDWEMRERYPAQRRRRIETAQMPLRKDSCEPFSVCINCISMTATYSRRDTIGDICS